MQDGESKVTFGSSATKLLLRQEGHDKRIRALEQATAPPSGLAKMRQHWMGILILLLWGFTQMLGGRLFTSERGRLVDAIATASAAYDRITADLERQIDESAAASKRASIALSRDRFFISDGLMGFKCGEDLADGLHQHFEDHETHGNFEKRPGLMGQALACKHGFAAASGKLRERLGR